MRRSFPYAIFEILFWATVAAAFKITLKYFDFLTMLFYSSLTAVTVLFLSLVIKGRLAELSRCRKGDYLRSLGLGFLNPFLYYLALFKAYAILEASIVATKGKIFSFTIDHPLGILLALTGSVIWALFWIFNLKDPQAVAIKLFWNFLFSFSLIAIVVLIREAPKPNLPGVVGAIYIGIFEMGMTFFIWLEALERAENTTRVANLIYLVPFLSLLFINILVGEPILFSSIIGLGLIVTGIILTLS